MPPPIPPLPRHSWPPSRVWVILLLLGLAAGAALLLAFDPQSASGYPPCMFRRLTGLYCPGCGSTRGLARLLRLDLAGAWSFNPMLVLAGPYLGYHLLAFLAWGYGGWRLPVPGLRSPAVWLLLATILFFWVARNLPYAPFSCLAPGAAS